MYIEYEWSNELIDPDKPDLSDTQLDGECESFTVPTNGWVDIRSAYKSQNEVTEFNYSQILLQELFQMDCQRVILNLVMCQQIICLNVAMSRISKLTVPVNHCW